MIEEKLLDEIFNEIGAACFNEKWSSWPLKSLVMNNVPPEAVTKQRKIRVDEETKRAAKLIENKVLRFLKNHRTQIGIRKLGAAKYKPIPKDFRVDRIYIPSSCLIQKGDWFECVLYINNKNYLRSRKKVNINGAGHPIDHEVTTIRSILPIALRNVEGRITYKKLIDALEVICLEQEIPCPQRTWLFEHCSDLIIKARNFRS